MYSSAKIRKNVTIHPFAYIDKNVEIGDDCEIASCQLDERYTHGEIATVYLTELLSLLSLRISFIREVIRLP